MACKRTTVLSPGQGAQYVGMGRDFFRAFQCAREIFQEADSVLSFDLSKLIFDDSGGLLEQTKWCQVAILTESVAVWSVIREEFGIAPHAAGGLSLGEYTALVVSGRLSFGNAVELVWARARYMHDESIKHPGKMAVCLGLSEEDVFKAIQPIPDLWVANYNSPSQFVISGSVDGVNEGMKVLYDRGAKRVVVLEGISGAFHTKYMQGAMERLKADVYGAEIVASGTLFATNYSGRTVSEDEIPDHLVKQLVSPVLWRQEVESLSNVTDVFLCIGCGGAKMVRIVDSVVADGKVVVCVRKIDDLDGVANVLGSDGKI